MLYLPAGYYKVDPNRLFQNIFIFITTKNEILKKRFVNLRITWTCAIPLKDADATRNSKTFCAVFRRVYGLESNSSYFAIIKWRADGVESCATSQTYFFPDREWTREKHDFETIYTEMSMHWFRTKTFRVRPSRRFDRYMFSMKR